MVRYYLSVIVNDIVGLNDSDLNRQLIPDCFRYGKPDKVPYFERPYLKKLRQLNRGQYGEVLSRSNLPSNYLKEWIGNKPIHYVQHHQSHAAARILHKSI